MTRPLLLPAVLGLVLLFAGGGWAQAPAKPTIALNVEAVDGHGAPVAGLTAGEFSIRDGGQPAPILDFQAVSGAAAASQQAFLVIDEVNAGFSTVAQARYAVLTYLHHAGAMLPIPMTVVLVTDTQVLLSGEPTRDGATLAEETQKAASTLRSINRSGGFYGAEDRTGISLHALDVLLRSAGTHPGRKLVLWLSPGWPYLAYPGTEFGDSARHSLFAETLSMRRRLLAAQVTLYALDPTGTEDSEGFQTTYYKNVLKPPLSWKDATTSNLGLQVLALQSGGLVLNSNNDVAHEIATCLRDAGAYYRITIPAAAAETPDAFHGLKVRIASEGVTARTIDGYYTP